MRALTRRGLRVRGAKCGPDYIDPAFHQAATGQPSFNLDSFAMATPLLDTLGAAATAAADHGDRRRVDGPVRRRPGGREPDRGERRHRRPLRVAGGARGGRLRCAAQSAAAVALGCTLYDPRVTDRRRDPEQGRERPTPAPRRGRHGARRAARCSAR
ncbi:hypothetical protein ACU4GR_31625 [Methylobacterium oryzae CBMB20]